MKIALIVVFLALTSTLALAAAAPSVATKFGIFREDCYDKYLDLDLSDMDCHKFTLGKGVGFAIVLGACILKVPQISKILANKSVDGIPALSCYAEFLNLVGLLANSMRLNLSFSVYGEAVFINIQNVLIILLVWKFNKSISIVEKIVFFLFTSVYAFVIFEGSMMTPELWDIVVSSQLVLQIIQRVPQIITTFKNGSTG